METYIRQIIEVDLDTSETNKPLCNEGDLIAITNGPPNSIRRPGTRYGHVTRVIRAERKNRRSGRDRRSA